MDYGSNENRFNSNRGYGGQGGGRDDNGGGYRSNFNASERSVIQIPGTHIGKIIGPGELSEPFRRKRGFGLVSTLYLTQFFAILFLAGRHINDLQRQYNVRIQINKMVSVFCPRMLF